MKQIYIDTYKGTFHPCDVECIKENPINGNYSIYFYDRADDAYCYAILEKENDEFFVGDIKYQKDRGAFLSLITNFQGNVDLSILPSFLKSTNHRTITNNDVYIETNAQHAFRLIKRLEFLELKSYADATKDPEYYYFIIDDMIPNIDGFSYKLRLSKISSEPLKKNIISRHTTGKSLRDLTKLGDIYYYTYNNREEMNIDIDNERVLVNKIIELNRGRRKNLDTELLTKVVRIMLAEEDKIKAAREYQMYLAQYYDKWVEERKYRK